jgi:hypothetical protein
MKEKEYERGTADVFFISDDGTGGFGSGENYDKLFDGSTSTKWCLNGGEGNPIYVIFHATHPIYVTGYKITTANDNASYSGRNPKTWTFYGSTADSNPGKDDASWEVIASVANDTKLQDVNFTTYTYKLPAETTKAYQSFKWEITARKGGGNNVIQVSEFMPTYTDALVGVGRPDSDWTNVNAVTLPFPNRGGVYNLAGQRLSRPMKGINIVQGKKFINVQ